MPGEKWPSSFVSRIFRMPDQLYPLDTVRMERPRVWFLEEQIENETRGLCADEPSASGHELEQRIQEDERGDREHQRRILGRNERLEDVRVNPAIERHRLTRGFRDFDEQ